MSRERLLGQYEILSDLLAVPELPPAIFSWASGRLTDLQDEASKIGLLLPHMEPDEYPQCV